jgi:hypothetical protein
MSKKYFFYLIILLSFSVFTSCNNSDLFEADDFISERTIKSERDNFKSALIESTIEQNLKTELNSDNEEKWLNAFRAMQLIQYKSETTENAIEHGLNKFEGTSYDFKRGLLEAAYSMHPGTFTSQIEKLLSQIDDRKLYAMAVVYLIKNDGSKENAEKYLTRLKDKYYDWGYHPITLMLYTQLDEIVNPKSEPLPPIEDLLLMDLGANTSVIYSFHRTNRNYPGISIIRKPDGSFVRNEDSSLFTVNQLARSISGLPFYITNGNTPSGIYKIMGISKSEDVYIGPSPTLVTALPFEEEYLNFTTPISKGDTLWDKKSYRQIFPITWHYHIPIYESFFAGWAGRNEIIVHGSTIDPEYYSDKPYYPFTPFIGCVTSFERWSDKTGELLESEQIELVNKYKQLQSEKGYMIVVDLDDKHEPVTTKDIMEFIVRTGK